MSHALHRLRQTFNDELMERTGHGMVPTQCALDLAEPVHAALQQLQQAVDQQLAFDPRTSERSFTLRVSPYFADSLLPRLCARVQSTAPKTILMIKFPEGYGPGSDNSGELQLRVCSEDWGAQYRQQRMLRNRFMVAMRHGHPAAGMEMTLDRFLSLRHLIVTGIGTPLIDNRLAANGRLRSIAVTLPSLSSVIPVLEQTDLCALLPERWIRLHCEPGRLATAPMPVPDFAFTVDMIWRTQDEGDAGLRWLRELIVAEFAVLYEAWAGPLDVASGGSSDRPER
jgi:DNA-binding transcriptional LysR family regulator